jgi:hypothetical protein
MRRLARIAAWAAIGLAGLALACAVPVATIEGTCTVSPDPSWQGGSRFGLAPDGYKRAAGDSYLTFPEWNIVHAYADLAGVTRSASESAFDYLSAISGFWTSLCGTTRAASRTGDVTAGQTVTNYIIGVSFTVEMAIQGGYERSLGALTAWSEAHGRGSLQRPAAGRVRGVPAPDALVPLPLRHGARAALARGAL